MPDADVLIRTSLLLTARQDEPFAPRLAATLNPKPSRPLTPKPPKPAARSLGPKDPTCLLLCKGPAVNKFVLLPILASEGFGYVISDLGLNHSFRITDIDFRRLNLAISRVTYMVKISNWYWHFIRYYSWINLNISRLKTKNSEIILVLFQIFSSIVIMNIYY